MEQSIEEERPTSPMELEIPSTQAFTPIFNANEIPEFNDDNDDESDNSGACASNVSKRTYIINDIFLANYRQIKRRRLSETERHFATDDSETDEESIEGNNLQKTICDTLNRIRKDNNCYVVESEDDGTAMWTVGLMRVDENGCVSANAIDVGFKQTVFQNYEGSHQFLAKRGLKISIQPEWFSIDVKADDIYRGLLSNNANYKRRAIHDVIEIFNNDGCPSFTDIVHFISRRSMGLVFYHGDIEEAEEAGAFGKERVKSNSLYQNNNEENDDLVPGLGGIRPIAPPKRWKTTKEAQKLDTNGNNRSIELSISNREQLFGECSYGRGHWHVIHDCKWHHATCRCHTWTCRKRLRTIQIKDNEEEFIRYFLSCVEYANQGSRCCGLIKVGPAKETWPEIEYYTTRTKPILHKNGTLLYERYTQVKSTAMAQCIVAKYKSGGGTDESNIQEVSGVQSGSGENVRGKRDRKKIFPESIVQFVLNNITYPITSIYQTVAWENSIFRFIQPSDKMFDRAMQNLRTKTMKWTIEDYIHAYSKSEHTNFACVNDRIEDYYYSPEESFAKIVHLLEYQLNCETENIDVKDCYLREFLFNIFNVCEKKIPKKNTIYVVSQPSAGKNFFFDMILTFYLNAGHIANFNKNSNFPFQDAILRRINLWNEPNFCESAIDTIKMLTAGDHMSVDIKFQAHVAFPRTPLFILTNKHVLKDKAFVDRVYRYDWRSAPFLAPYDKKPHPLTWLLLLSKYNIISYSHMPAYKKLFPTLDTISTDSDTDGSLFEENSSDDE